MWTQFYPYRNNKVSVWHMARLPITEAECTRILSLPKRITDDIVWSKKTNKSWASSKVPVDSELKGKLEIIITVNMDEPSKFSITLLLNSTHRICGLDMRGSHHNKCSDQSRWDGKMHKHSWRDDCPGGHAYTPSDINVKDIGDVFKQFCRECNISFKGNVNPLPIQTRFTGV